ncbi:MAG: gliding motility-associated C-terminal domain-containing protein [Flavobacteriales bacterium]
MRVDNDGNILWQKMISSATDDGDTPRDILELSDGTIVLVGTSNTFTFGTSDAFVQRYTAGGQFMWGVHRGGTANEHFYSVIESSNGTILCAGNNQSSANQSYGAWLVEFNMNGQVLNQRIYDSPGLDSFLGLTESPDGGYFATIQTNYSGSPDIGLMRIESNLISDWCRHVPSTGTDWPVDVWLQPNGNPLVVGVSADIGPAANNIVTLQFNPAGDLQSADALGFLNNDGAQGISRISDRDSAGNYFICGYTDIAGQMDVALHKLDACGVSSCSQSMMVSTSVLPFSQFDVSSGSGNYPAFQSASIGTNDAATALINYEVLCEIVCPGTLVLQADTACQGTVLELVPEFTGPESGVISWWVDGLVTTTGPELQLLLDDPGVYVITAELEDSNGCTYSATSEVVSLPIPLIPDADDLTSCAAVELEGVIPDATWLDSDDNTVQIANESGTYTATITNFCGTASTEVEITIFSASISLEVSNLISCLEPTAVITAGPAGVIQSIDWYSPGLELIGNGSQLEVNNAGIYLATGITSEGCPFSIEASVSGSSDNLPAPLVSLSGTMSCTMDGLMLVIGNSSIYESISVLFPNGTVINLANNEEFVAISEPGTYLITGQSGPCNAVSSIDAPTPSWPEGYFSILPFTELNCNQQETSLQVSPFDNSNEYFWFDGQGNLVGTGSGIVVSVPGNYLLEVSGAFESCFFADTIEVNADLTQPFVLITPSAYSILCEGGQVALQLETNVKNAAVAWSHDDELLPETDQTLNTGEAGTYVAVVTDPGNGCSSEYSIVVTESLGTFPDISRILFPNIFTPNFDSKNEQWRPIYDDPSIALLPEHFSFWDLKIYNRWGSLLHSESSNHSDILDGWDGSGLPDGVYYFHLVMSGVCESEERIVREGYIHIVR